MKTRCGGGQSPSEQSESVIGLMIFLAACAAIVWLAWIVFEPRVEPRPLPIHASSRL